MAKITMGAIASQISGTAASTTFARNRGKAYFRNRVVPINRRSVGQGNKRQLLAALAAQWRGLSQAQRNGWDNASQDFPIQDSLGQTITLTGEQLYVRFNANLNQVGVAPISDAPAPVAFAILALGATVASDDNVITQAFTPTPVPTGFALVIRATGPRSPGISFVSQSAFRFIQFVAAAGTSPANIATAYQAIFGSLAGKVGQKIFVEAFLVSTSTGQAGQKVRTSHIVTAA